MQQKIQSHAREEMDKTQREYYLREQLKAIQKELGETDERGQEMQELEQKVARRRCPARSRRRPRPARPPGADAPGRGRGVGDPDLPRLAHRVCRGQADRRTTSASRRHRRSSTRTTTTWRRSRSGSSSSGGAQAETETKKEMKGPILCFVGPPGVGKTSLGRSIAAPSGESSCASRWAACGTRRRSAATGGPTSAPCRAGSSRASSRPGPTIRSSCSTRSTRSAWTSGAIPSAALLEVLDPEQNSLVQRPLPRGALRPVQVMFITTANIDRPHPAAAEGPDGDHRAPGLHRG